MEILTIEPTEKHTATIIFLHGFGDTGHGWMHLLRTIMPGYVKLICPTAPPISAEKMKSLGLDVKVPSWYDFYPDKLTDDVEGVKKAHNDIVNLIQGEPQDLSQITGAPNKPRLPASRIILGGFSQGAALSLYTGLKAPMTLGGIVALSGYLASYHSFDWNDIKKPPVLLCHGDLDQKLPLPIALLLSKQLEKNLTNFTFKAYKGLGHASCEEELNDIKKFIVELIPPI